MNDPDFGTDPHKLYRPGDPDTSREAAYAVNTTRLEQEVLEVVRRYGERGCIQDQVLHVLALYPYSSVTARFKALLDKRLIYDTGERRQGRSGRGQRVLCVTPPASP